MGFLSGVLALLVTAQLGTASSAGAPQTPAQPLPRACLVRVTDAVTGSEAGPLRERIEAALVAASDFEVVPYAAFEAAANRRGLSLAAPLNREVLTLLANDVGFDIALVARMRAPAVAVEVELSAHAPHTLARLGGAIAQFSIDLDGTPLKGFTPARARVLVRALRDAMGRPPPAPVAAAEPAIEPFQFPPTGDAPSGADAPGAKAPQKEGLSIAGIPALNYNADNGFGFGAIAGLYWHEKGLRPYKAALDLQVFGTTKLVQDHIINLDIVDAFDLPVRASLRLGYFQTISQNFCGFGNNVTCDESTAEQLASQQGLSPDDATAFADHYYANRFHMPYGVAGARVRVLSGALRVELTGGWRGALYVPGDAFSDSDGIAGPDLTPYAGSLYATIFPGGQPGFASVFQAGVVVDTRDNEPMPRKGVWLEAAARGSSRYAGSSWDYAGATLIGRLYAPVLRDRSIVMASRTIVDAMVGDPPFHEMSYIGGSKLMHTFGGLDAGRGIRSQHFVGRVKVLDQTELRWHALEFTGFSQRFMLTTLAFIDGGFVGEDLATLANSGLPRLHIGYGGGLRLSWNENFIIRLDIGLSPEEQFSPAPYLQVGNVF